MLSSGRTDMTTPPPPGCLDPVELAALMDGTLGAAARAVALAHVDGCPECYELLAESARALDVQAAAPAAPARRWPLLAALAAAAGLTALLVRNPAHSPDRPALPTPVPEARVASPSPAPPPARTAAADPVASLLARSTAVVLAGHAWSDEGSLGFSSPDQRYQALVAGAYQTDLDVAGRVAGADIRDLRERVAAAEPARRRHPDAFALGRLLEAARLAAAVRDDAFFADGSVRAALGAMAPGEPDAHRRQALQRALEALGAGPGAARPWKRLQSNLDEALGQ